jgi:hypothetical protein
VNRRHGACRDGVGQNGTEAGSRQTDEENDDARVEVITQGRLGQVWKDGSNRPSG